MTLEAFWKKKKEFKARKVNASVMTSGNSEASKTGKAEYIYIYFPDLTKVM